MGQHDDLQPDSPRPPQGNSLPRLVPDNDTIYKLTREVAQAIVIDGQSAESVIIHSWSVDKLEDALLGDRLLFMPTITYRVIVPVPVQGRGRVFRVTLKPVVGRATTFNAAESKLRLSESEGWMAFRHEGEWRAVSEVNPAEVLGNNQTTEESADEGASRETNGESVDVAPVVAISEVGPQQGDGSAQQQEPEGAQRGQRERENEEYAARASAEDAAVESYMAELRRNGEKAQRELREQQDAQLNSATDPAEN